MRDLIKKLKNYIKKHPFLYKLLKYIYFNVRPKRIREVLYGTAEREREWATRHLSKKGNNDLTGKNTDWIKGYWDSVDHPHRKFLADKIGKYSSTSFPRKRESIKSILEVGSCCGTNLAVLSKKLPQVDMTGVDINPEAVRMGNQWLKEEGFSNVKLLCAKADELDIFGDNSFDIVFTDALLVCIGPDKIMGIMENLLRIAKFAVFLCEWNDFLGQDKHGTGICDIGFWKRDYKTLLKNIVSEEKVNIIKIPEHIWPLEGWKEYGAIVEITK